MDLIETIDSALATAVRKIGKVNILIADKTGVGKSTLINGIFEGNLATTGQGKPVTKETRRITKRGVPLAIFDTRGLEVAAYKEVLTELKSLIDKLRASPNPKSTFM